MRAVTLYWGRPARALPKRSALVAAGVGAVRRARAGTRASPAPAGVPPSSSVVGEHDQELADGEPGLAHPSRPRLGVNDADVSHRYFHTSQCPATSPGSPGGPAVHTGMLLARRRTHGNSGVIVPPGGRRGRRRGIKTTWRFTASCRSVIRIRRLTFHEAAEHHVKTETRTGPHATQAPYSTQVTPCPRAVSQEQQPASSTLVKRT